MPMYPQELGSIPEETALVARAACPKGTLAMRLRDALADLDQDEQFAALSPTLFVKVSIGLRSYLKSETNRLFNKRVQSSLSQLTDRSLRSTWLL